LDLILRLMWRGQQAAVCLASLRVTSFRGGEATKATGSRFAAGAVSSRLDSGAGCRKGEHEHSALPEAGSWSCERYPPESGTAVPRIRRGDPTPVRELASGLIPGGGFDALQDLALIQQA